MSTFEDLFCERLGIDASSYVEEMLRRCLYRRARVFVPFRLMRRELFAFDHELIRAVGQARSLAEVHTEIADFASHPANRGLLRGRLKLRISGRRVYRLACSVYSAQRVTITSAAPFAR